MYEHEKYQAIPNQTNPAKQTRLLAYAWFGSLNAVWMENRAIIVLRTSLEQPSTIAPLVKKTQSGDNEC